MKCFAKVELVMNTSHRMPLRKRIWFWLFLSLLLSQTSFSNDGLPPIREGPKVLKGGELGLGRMIPDLQFKDLDGKSLKLSDFQNRKAVVIALTGTGCPLCQKYAPSLAAIEEAYHRLGVSFIYVNPNESEMPEVLRKEVQKRGLTGSYVWDPKMQISNVLEAKTTTEVFVLDKARTLVYRGAVDDQYGFGYALDAPRRNYLKDALNQVIKRGKPSVSATSAPGCELFYGDQKAPQQDALTYHNRISRILQANCIECHRDGGIGPMSLETYVQVEDHAGMIRRVVQREIMPPWFAAPQTDNSETTTAKHWANDRSLSEKEKTDLLSWIKAGAPEGDPKDAPLPLEFPDGWRIGKPDAIFGFSKPVSVKATGSMPYKNITVETNLSEDKWVQAIEVRPGNPSVVHHVIVSVKAGNGEIDERDGYWGVYVPGNSTLVYPEGYAKKLSQGAKLRFQMHYTPNGTATEDLTRIGLIFAKEPPKHEVKVKGIANAKIRIPPGAGNHREVAKLQLPIDVQVLGFLPHMHLRGTAARYEVVSAKGTETLLDIPRYDFNWQLLYRLSEPKTLRRGDSIHFTAWFDNSAQNPANPDPNKTVRWGPQTEDEMHLGYIEYVIPSATPGESVAGLGRKARNQNRGAALFRRLDVNRDGAITREEVRKQLPGNAKASGKVFDLLDKDGNGKLDPKELAELQRLRQ